MINPSYNSPLSSAPSPPPSPSSIRSQSLSSTHSCDSDPTTRPPSRRQDSLPQSARLSAHFPKLHVPATSVEVIPDNHNTSQVSDLTTVIEAKNSDTVPLAKDCISRPKRPSSQRNSSYIRRLELDAALEREKFGLADLHVSTSPYEEEIYIQLPEYKSEAETEADIVFSASAIADHHTDIVTEEDIGMVSSADMSKQETIRAAPSPATPSNLQQNSARTPTPAIAVPTTSRMRNPVPPSPLSKVSSTSPDRHTGLSSHTPAASVPNSQNRPISPPDKSSFTVPQSSPCFIHSHLDKHGSLQDWLNNKSSIAHGSSSGASVSSSTANASSSTYKPHTHAHAVGNATKPSRQPSYGNYTHHQHNGNGNNEKGPSYGSAQQYTHSHPGSPASSRITSPKMRESSNGGYESDQSSANGALSRLSGSAILDGDLIDDDEEVGSLTRQLAETAQGVREMSKELGRTRVRSKIQHVLIVTKARDNRLIKLTRELALYLMQKRPTSSPDGAGRPNLDGRDRGMVVYVDAQLRASKRFDAEGLKRDYPHLFQPIIRRRSSSSASVNNLSAYPSSTSMAEFSRKNKDEGQLRYWTAEMCSNSPHLFDFVVTLGGDGTVLFTSWLFQRIVPPILPFALGSLGFLTNFDFAQYKQTMDRVVDEGVRVNLRMRFTCTVYRAVAPEEAAAAAAGKGGKKRKAIKKPGGEILMSCVDKKGWESLEGATQFSSSESEGRDKEIMCFSTRPVEQFEVLNDLVVDRGPSPFVSLLEVFGDEHHLTTVQADGLTVSTPTGSTAYSLSAGGSLVHPQIPAILITPICPHTLSFRPMLLPDSMELRICVPYNSRSTAWASFDGRGRVELKQGDHIKVTASKYPFPTVCADKASTDWFSSISRTLRWNEREKQKSFVVVEEDTEPAPVKGHGEDAKQRKKKDQKELDQRSQRAQKEKSRADNDIEEQTGEDDEDDEEDEDDDEEEEEFDIDDKSGGETAPTSPPMPATTQPAVPPQKLRSSLLHVHKSGVETPSRFATPYDAPPPLSQRHLVDALHAAELREKDNEHGQRDNIRSDDSREFRVEGQHLIPPGRSNLTSPNEGEDSKMMLDQKTPRPSISHAHHSISQRSQSHHHHHHHHHHNHIPHPSPSGRTAEGKAKAFAFFGQDDSASDMSDDHSDA